MSRGRLIVLAGPSGVGKNTLLKSLATKHAQLKRVVSFTTRQPRPGEQNGVDYNFVEPSEFSSLDKTGQILEKVEYAHDWYGTPKNQINEGLAAGENLITVVEVDGANRLKDLYPDNTVRIFILPPDIEALKDRLRKRHTETDKELTSRLARVDYEVKQGQTFEYMVINPEGAPEQAVEEIERILSLN